MNEQENKAQEVKAANEEVIEKPIELNDESIQKVKEAIAEEVRQEAGISDEQAELFKQMCIEADMPVEFLDKDFKLGSQELDIRKLSKKNLLQLYFRQQTLHQIYLKQIHNSLLDITRLLMVFLDKYGIEDIVKSTDDVQAKLEEQQGLKRKELEEAAKAAKEQENNKSN